jgi:hypothetical protein
MLGIFGALFGGSKTSRPQDQREKWKAIREGYDPGSPESHRLLAAMAYETIYNSRNDPELIAYNAAHHIALMAHYRKYGGADVSRVSSPTQPLPLPPDHPMLQSIKFFDGAIKYCMDQLATQTFSEKLESSMFVGKVMAASIWRNYLLALCRPVDEWDVRETCALSAFRLLSTVSQTDVVEQMHLVSPSIEKEIQDGDWPPSGYIAFYLKHRQDIENLCRKFYGRSM